MKRILLISGLLMITIFGFAMARRPEGRRGTPAWVANPTVIDTTNQKYIKLGTGASREAAINNAHEQIIGQFRGVLSDIDRLKLIRAFALLTESTFNSQTKTRIETAWSQREDDLLQMQLTRFWTASSSRYYARVEMDRIASGVKYRELIDSCDRKVLAFFTAAGLLQNTDFQIFVLLDAATAVDFLGSLAKTELATISPSAMSSIRPAYDSEILKLQRNNSALEMHFRIESELDSIPLQAGFTQSLIAPYGFTLDPQGDYRFRLVLSRQNPELVRRNIHRYRYVLTMTDPSDRELIRYEGSSEIREKMRNPEAHYLRLQGEIESRFREHLRVCLDSMAISLLNRN